MAQHAAGLTIQIRADSLVVLVGAAGSGKSTFARQHFRPTQILSSDAIRAMIADDEDDQTASRAAFEILHLIASHRLTRGRLTVVDATNVRPAARAALLRIARSRARPAAAIVLDLPVGTCIARNATRPDRVVDSAVIEAQAASLHRSLDALGGLSAEGFDEVYVLSSAEAVDEARIVVRGREPGA